MHARVTSTGHNHVQPLEARRLLSLTPLGPEAAVPGTNLAVAADLAVAANGSYVVATAALSSPDRDSDPPGVISVVRYSASGDAFGPPLNLDTTGSAFLGLSTSPIAASIDPDGDAVVAYRRDQGVYVVRISGDGVASAPQRVDAAPADGLLHSPAVSMDESGGFFVGWVEQGEDADFIQIRAFDAAGAPRGPQFSPRSVSHTLHLNGLHDLDIAAFPDGSGAVFTYNNTSGEGAGSVGFGRVSTTALVGSLGSVGSFGADVAVHADGSFVIGYVEGNLISPISKTWVSAQRYDAAGTPVGDEIRLDDLVPVGGQDPRTHSVSIDAMPDGGFVAAFVYTVRVGGSINPNRDFSTIYARRYDPAGMPDPSGLIVLDSPPYDSHSLEEIYIRPALGVDANGTIVAAYQQPSPIDAGVVAGPVHHRRLSGDVAFNDRGDLYVFGTNAADHITVERVREKVFVNVNGTVKAFAASEVVFLSINGFGGDDDIDNNTAFRATIHGGDGHDTIWGGTNDDRIRGQGGDDLLRGGNGNDSVLGDSGSDFVHGGDDQDDLIGDTGEDTLIGADGNDGLHGGRGSDWLYGEADDDLLEGGDAPDYFEAGAGNDILIGGGGADALFGLAGNDQFFTTGDTSRDTVRGGAGTDSAEVDDLDDVIAVERLS